MSPYKLLFILLGLSSIGYWLSRKKAFAISKKSGPRVLHSNPVYYGSLTAMSCLIPSLIMFFLWLSFEAYIISNQVINALPQALRELPSDRLNLLCNDIQNLVSGNIIISDSINSEIRSAANHYIKLKEMSHLALTVTVIIMAVTGIIFIFRKIRPEFKARNYVERIVNLILLFCSCIAILTTIGILLSVLYEAVRFFKIIPIDEFLLGMKWSPQMAIRTDQVGSSGAFGAIPVVWGTFMISGIAMMIAVPIGLMSAIYLSEYANRKFRLIAKPLLEILAGIPTVVYGFFAVLIIAPMIKNIGSNLGLDISSESALSAGLVMGIMIIPFISSISDDVLNAVPQSLRDGALGLGSTHSETIRYVVLPAALPGIVGGVLLAVSRAIGETMIVVMAAGLSANMTMNPLKAVTTVTVQIVTLLVGDQEFDSPKTLVAFALGLLLFLMTLILNIIALIMVKKYREQYE